MEIINHKSQSKIQERKKGGERIQNEIYREMIISKKTTPSLPPFHIC